MLPGEEKKCLEEDADWFMSTGRFLLVFLVTKKKEVLNVIYVPVLILLTKTIKIKLRKILENLKNFALATK